MDVKRVKIVEDYFKTKAFGMLRSAGQGFKYPYLDPGEQYLAQLWDWDSYFAAVCGDSDRGTDKPNNR